jgi:protein-S-isoprenylcysteine O-methyltransferase Ste14
MNVWKQLPAILLLPGVVVVAVPAIILYRTGFFWTSSVALPMVGFVFMLLGLALMVWTNRLFTTAGQGTLAPWNPLQKLVVRGVYMHVRNPMLTGVFCILLGEAVFFGSLPLLGWFATVVLVNVIYIPLVEEPGLAQRFGDDYLRYKDSVPRWIPRLKPWRGLSRNE